MGNPVDYSLYLPANFLQKEVNEQIVAELSQRALGFLKLRRGDPLLREPDFIADGAGLEVTFASRKEASPAFISQFCDGRYTDEDANRDQTVYILGALERKRKKRYSIWPVSVAVLCMLELFGWTGGGCPEGPGPGDREAFFERIRGEYLTPGIFGNVYLLVPSLDRSWVLFDVGGDRRYRLPVGAGEKRYPYYERVAPL